MNKTSLLLISILIFLVHDISGQDPTFEEYNPISTLVVSSKKILKAKFSFIDIHGHQYRMANQDLAPVIEAMDSLNMGIMVNLSGRSGNILKQSVKNINDHYPNRFVVFANINFDGVGKENWSKQVVQQLKEDITNGARGLKRYKSLGLHYVDIDGNRIKVDDPRLDPIWNLCGEMGLPVLIHTEDPKSFWDDFDGDNEALVRIKNTSTKKKRCEYSGALATNY